MPVFKTPRSWRGHLTLLRPFGSSSVQDGAPCLCLCDASQKDREKAGTASYWDVLITLRRHVRSWWSTVKSLIRCVTFDHQFPTTAMGQASIPHIIEFFAHFSCRHWVFGAGRSGNVGMNMNPHGDWQRHSTSSGQLNTSFISQFYQRRIPWPHLMYCSQAAHWSGSILLALLVGLVRS